MVSSDVYDRINIFKLTANENEAANLQLLLATDICPFIVFLPVQTFRT